MIQSMRAREVALHALFGVFELLVIAVAFKVWQVRGMLDAGVVLKVALANQFLLVFCSACFLWAATCLWIRDDRPRLARNAFLSDADASAPVKRLRRLMWYCWLGILANMLLVASLI